MSQKNAQHTEKRHFARNFADFDPFFRGAQSALRLEFWKILLYTCGSVVQVFVYQVASNLDGIGGATRQQPTVSVELLVH